MRNYRRKWNLSFSSLEPHDILNPNSHTMSQQQIYNDTGGANPQDVDGANWDSNLYQHDSFYSQVLNKVGDGTKFIFNPNHVEIDGVCCSQPSDYCIASIETSSLKIKKVANGLYDISFSVIEHL